MSRSIRTGSLTLIDRDGNQFAAGDGLEPAVTVKFHDARIAWQLVVNPSFYLGEAYVKERLTLEQGTIGDLLELSTMNRALHEPSLAECLAQLLLRPYWWARQYQSPGGAQRNVAHHYDLSHELYQLFLDSGLQYSCAQFRSTRESLEQAQQNKKQQLAAKLCLQPGQRVLDIGCGWGGLATDLAEWAQVAVHGITLSEEQQAFASEQIERRGLEGRVEIELADYRSLKERFDRVVSVGMFEHVGLPQYRQFFRQVARCLADDGIALLHTIGRSDGPNTPNRWFDKYIFPGGYAPALSEIVPAIEAAGLCVTDIEVLRLHYAETVRRWRRRFERHRGEARRLYDERFCRIWEFYLAASEAAFRHGGHVVFQIQMAKRQDAVPLTRAYLGVAPHGAGAPTRDASADSEPRITALDCESRS